MTSSHRSPGKRGAGRAAVASLLALAAVGWGGSAQAATGSSAASAKVVAPIAISTGLTGANSLRFGSFSSTGTAGTVVISATGGRTFSSDTVFKGVGTGQAPFGAAQFNVTGEANLTYAITLPTGDVTLIHTVDNTKTMLVNAFISNPSATGSGNLGAGGSQTLAVGATLNVGATPTAGSYTGSFDVSVDYN
jgi:hypothetical protein